MIELVEKELCTGCGACSFACPKNCICMIEDDNGVVYPQIDHSICIECNKCKKTCPLLSFVGFNYPIEAYAAYSSDSEERKTSASGGVAAEIYKEAIKKGYKIAGASLQNDFTVKIEIANENNISSFKNSKYVFSDAYNLFPELKKLLKEGNKCIVIALPCQIAAIRKAFDNDQNLLLVDVVCHGTTPHRVLAQHISNIEKDKNIKAHKVYFRDPNVDTMSFSFSLYDKAEHCFYIKSANNNDMYQFGYHRAITYRENCYNCSFAKSYRVSDITISDYKGLGRLAPTIHVNHKISSVLVNTEKGREFIYSIIGSGNLIVEKRPIQEPILGDRQLREPSKKTLYRNSYIRRLKKCNGQFDKAIRPVYYQYIFCEGLKKNVKYPFYLIKRVIRKAMNIFRTIK